MSKILAIYYPQYHSIPENDESWGKDWNDFTWLKDMKESSVLNLIKPHKDVGYYSLLDYDVRKRQAKMAKEYGIYGFVFYHYWFYGYEKNGVKCKTLYEIAEKMLIDGEPNINFCFNWANENWTKKWNNDNNIIFENKYTENENEIIEHFNYLLPFFKNPNYIKINNKPVFIIYNIELVKYCTKIINIFKSHAVLNGFSGIFFMQTVGMSPTPKVDTILPFVDGVYETCPNYSFRKLYETGEKNYKEHIKNNILYLDDKKIETKYSNNKDENQFYLYNTYINNKILEKYNLTLEKYIENMSNDNKIISLSRYTVYELETLYKIIVNEEPKMKNNFKGFTPGFNNTPRTKDKCKETIIINNRNKYDLFYEYFSKIIQNTNKNDNLDEKFIFINAWNEWGEGMCIEPSNLNGYAYLNIIKRCLIENNCFKVHHSINIVKECVIKNSVFNIDFYRSYPDLKNFNDVFLKNHYDKTGFYEKRISSKIEFEKRYNIDTNIITDMLYIDKKNKLDENLFFIDIHVNNKKDYFKKKKLCIMTTYRNRPENLKKFIETIHISFMIHNKYDYDIHVIEQDNDEIFQKTKLWNSGIDILKNDYDYFIFHDLDSYPSIENNFNYLYNIPENPYHLSAYNEQYDYIMNTCKCNNKKNCVCDFFYNIHLFGGVFLCSKEHILKINGFSSNYYGWGCEDCDIFYRFKEYFKPSRRHGIYNNDDHEKAHRYFMNYSYIYNNKYFKNFVNAMNKKKIMNGDGITTTDYKINNKNIDKNINYYKIDFKSCYLKYYVIINIFNNKYLKYIENIIAKFNNNNNKPEKIFILNKYNVKTLIKSYNNIQEIYKQIDNSYGLIYINLDNIIIGDINYLISLSNSTKINYMQSFYSINSNENYNEFILSNDWNHCYYSNIVLTEKIKKNYIYENKFQKYKFDIINFMEKYIKNNENLYFNFKNSFDIEKNILLCNAGIFKNILEYNNIIYNSVIPNIEIVDIVFDDIIAYDYIIYIPPLIIKLDEKNIINKNIINYNIFNYFNNDIINYFNNNKENIKNWMNNESLSYDRIKKPYLNNTINNIITMLLKNRKY